jgi:hypothetical protein
MRLRVRAAGGRSPHIAVVWDGEPNGSGRLGPATRLFDLSAPEQTLNVQNGGQQCGNEIDSPSTRVRPEDGAPDRPHCGRLLGAQGIAQNRRKNS